MRKSEVRSRNNSEVGFEYLTGGHYLGDKGFADKILQDATYKSHGFVANRTTAIIKRDSDNYVRNDPTRTLHVWIEFTADLQYKDFKINYSDLCGKVPQELWGLSDDKVRGIHVGAHWNFSSKAFKKDDKLQFEAYMFNREYQKQNSIDTNSGKLDAELMLVSAHLVLLAIRRYRFFRERGLICQTFTRDVVLVYNHLWDKCQFSPTQSFDRDAVRNQIKLFGLTEDSAHDSLKKIHEDQSVMDPESFNLYYVRDPAPTFQQQQKEKAEKAAAAKAAAEKEKAEKAAAAKAAAEKEKAEKAAAEKEKAEKAAAEKAKQKKQAASDAKIKILSRQSAYLKVSTVTMGVLALASATASLMTYELSQPEAALALLVLTIVLAIAGIVTGVVDNRVSRSLKTLVNDSQSAVQCTQSPELKQKHGTV